MSDSNPFTSDSKQIQNVPPPQSVPLDLEQTAAPKMEHLLKSTPEPIITPSKHLSSGAMIAIIVTVIAIPLIGVIVYVALTIQHKNPTYTPGKLPDRPSGNYNPTGGKVPANLPSSRVFDKVFTITPPGNYTHFGYRAFSHDTGWVVACSTSSVYGSTTGHNLFFYKPGEYSGVYQTLSFFENSSDSSRYGTAATSNAYGGRFVIVDGCFAPSITSAASQIYYLFLSIGVAVTFPDNTSVKLSPASPDPTNYCATEVHLFTYDTSVTNAQWTHQYNTDWPLQHPSVKLNRFWNPQFPYIRTFGQRLKCIVSGKGRHELYISATASDLLENRNSSVSLGIGGSVFHQLLLNNGNPPALDDNMSEINDIRLFYINDADGKGVTDTTTKNPVPSYDKLSMGPMDYLYGFGYDFDVSNDLCSVGNPGIMEFTALGSPNETRSPQGYVQTYTRTDKAWVQNYGGDSCKPDIDQKPVPDYGCEGLRYSYCQNYEEYVKPTYIGSSFGAGVKQYLSKYMLTCLGYGMKTGLAAWRVYNIPTSPGNDNTFSQSGQTLDLSMGTGNSKKTVTPVSSYGRDVPPCDDTPLPTNDAGKILPFPNVGGFVTRHNAVVTSENRLLLGVYNGTKGGDVIAYVDPWGDKSSGFAQTNIVQLLGDSTSTDFQNSNNSSVPKVDSYGYGQFMGSWDSVKVEVQGVPVVYAMVNDPNYNAGDNASGRVLIYYKLAST